MKALTLSEFTIQLMKTDLRSYIKHIGLEYNKCYPLLNIVNYTKFLNQEFKPEMIELFEDLEILANRIFQSKNFFQYDDSLYPKSLGDFILFCSYAGIDLYFKEQK